MTLKVSGLNITFCEPARDTLLSNQDTEKLNFDSNVKTTFLICELTFRNFTHQSLNNKNGQLRLISS